MKKRIRYQWAFILWAAGRYDGDDVHKGVRKMKRRLRKIVREACREARKDEYDDIEGARLEADRIAKELIP